MSLYTILFSLVSTQVFETVIQMTFCRWLTFQFLYFVAQARLFTLFCGHNSGSFHSSLPI